MVIHVVLQGDTIDSIADLYGVSSEKIILDNELANPYELVPGQTIVIVYPAQTHTVQEGDTLDHIAAAYGVSVMQLLRNNPFLSKRENIYPGETLTISYHTGGNLTTNGFCYPFISKELLKKTLPNLTYLSVFNYRALKEGELISYYDDTEIVKLAKEYDTLPLLMFSTLSAQGQPDIEVSYELLLNEEYQKKQIENLQNIMKSKGYSGVNIVFNFISATNKSLYENFVKRASDILKADGFLVFVTINTIIRKENGIITFEQTDYSVISNAVDGVIFLELIWGTNHNPPGPISSIEELSAFVDYTVSSVAQDKFVIGEPILAYDWPLPYIPNKTVANSLTIDAAIRLAYDVNTQIQFDPASQSPYYTYSQYTGFPVQHIVWFTDARSYNALLTLVKEHELFGTGIWSIMVYESQLWLVVNSQYNIVKQSPENR